MRAGLLLATLLCLACGLARAAEPVIAIVVPAARSGAGLDADAIAQVYKRKRLLWPDGRRMLPVNLPADHPLRKRFTDALLQLGPEALEEYWNEQYFHGIRPPHVVASEAAVLRFVADTSNAIGYLSYCAMDQRVRPLLLISPEGRLLPPDTTVNCAAD
ncbi:MAG TPA: hypothetical protein VLI06_19480 [Solimonas sp.]|nr:hypothetical protein [Solimonas sp.]